MDDSATAPVTSQPTGRRVNTLAGVVVSKADGKPVAGARVAMAYANRGYIMLENGGKLSNWSGNETVWLFFRKVNGQAVVEATTDAKGQFRLTDFMTPNEDHTLVAVHKDAGLTIRTAVVPKQPADGELRIELEPPARIRLGDAPHEDDATVWTVLLLAPLRDPPPGVDADDPNDDTRFRGENQVDGGVFLSFQDQRSERTPNELGPLPAGRRYQVWQRLYPNGPSNVATLMYAIVEVKSGETTDLRKADGVEIEGNVTSVRGTPLAGVNVRMRMASPRRITLGAVTDGKGHYRIAGVVAGRHTLDLVRFAPRSPSTWAPGARDVSLSREIDVSADQKHIAIDVAGVSVRGVVAGEPAPDFEADTIGNELFALSEQRDKLVLIHFWSTAAQDYKSDISVIRETLSKHAEDGLVVLGVALEESKMTVRDYARRRRMGWPQVLAPDGLESDLPKIFGIGGEPATVLIGPDGKVLARDLHRGALGERIDKEIAAMQRDASPASSRAVQNDNK